MAGTLRVGEFYAAQIGSTAVPGLMATAAVMVIAAVIGLTRRDALGWVVVLQAVLISTLGWRTLLYPHENSGSRRSRCCSRRSSSPST